MDQSVQRQYQQTDPLKVRMETHRRYEERAIDLDAESSRVMRLTGAESILEVGCGPGRFLAYLRQSGHTGRLVGLDQSAGMIAEAQAAPLHPPVEWQVGDALDLRHGPGAFQWVVARHMLYHVPDIPAALREFGRVAGPAGGVYVTTNARTSLPRIFELLDDLLAAFGHPTRGATAADTFHTGNAPDLLGAAFGQVAAEVLQNALVFTTPEPIVAYLASTFPSLPIPHEPALWAEMAAWLHDAVARRLRELGGTWRDPKDVGLYRCTAPVASPRE